ncbi:hypothetical protein Pen02_04760 [Plantactinospora endophytica]|uniref:DivIVA domain-containing protein n=1 Tax=Plantactinospora endophytica TaxID=673535 RepID=A0ABQ4DSV2_9ACTN|nr:hypothetical protein Pen02_04760 [Plantactinospora endophytica]
MGQVLLLLVVALTVAAVVFGVTVLVTGSDPGLGAAEPDGRAVPLPGNRPLLETDVGQVRFDMALRGYRMAQVDQALRRTAYDIGYKDELIGVLQAEVTALREGRVGDADVLRRAREASLVPAGSAGTASDTTAERSLAPTVAAGATTGGLGVHSSPVPSVSGAASGSGERSGPTAPAPLEFQRAEFGPDSSDRPEPAPAEHGTASTGARADGADRADDADRAGDAGRAGERADDIDPGAPTRPLRVGGSVIETEDGDLAEPTAPLRPAATADAAPGNADEGDDEEPTRRTRPVPAGALAEPGEPVAETPTARVRRPADVDAAAAVGSDEPTDETPTARVGRPAQADASAESGEPADGTSNGPARRPTQAGGPSGPAEQPERA